MILQLELGDNDEQVTEYFPNASLSPGNTAQGKGHLMQLALPITKKPVPDKDLQFSEAANVALGILL